MPTLRRRLSLLRAWSTMSSIPAAKRGDDPASVGAGVLRDPLGCDGSRTPAGNDACRSAPPRRSLPPRGPTRAGPDRSARSRRGRSTGRGGWRGRPDARGRAVRSAHRRARACPRRNDVRGSRSPAASAGRRRSAIRRRRRPRPATRMTTSTTAACACSTSTRSARSTAPDPPCSPVRAPKLSDRGSPPTRRTTPALNIAPSTSADPLTMTLLDAAQRHMPRPVRALRRDAEGRVNHHDDHWTTNNHTIAVSTPGSPPLVVLDGRVAEQHQRRARRTTPPSRPATPPTAPGAVASPWRPNRPLPSRSRRPRPQALRPPRNGGPAPARGAADSGPRPRSLW